ncbi:hypothetical protein [Rheinheimera sp.]|uniref:hypothetical protein n=1 Tax=Rheinheimera sp. TaxID=1869214 RepID=UPI003D2B9D75
MMFKSLFKTGLTTLVVAAGLLSSAAFAHTDEYLDTVVGPNGGQLRMAGAYHFELVLAKDAKAGTPSAVKLYLLDHANNPQPAKEAKATVLIVSGKQKAKADLTLAQANLLSGNADYTAAEDLKAVVNVTIKTEHGEVTEQAKFTPFKPVPAKAEHEHGHEHEHGREHAEDSKHKHEDGHEKDHQH